MNVARRSERLKVNLRQLFDRLTPGALDSPVSVVSVLRLPGPGENVLPAVIQPILDVRVQDDGSIWLLIDQ